MLQIATIFIGIVAVAMGIKTLASGEVRFSRETTLREGSARAAGIIAILIGLGILVFALVGFGLLLNQR